MSGTLCVLIVLLLALSRGGVMAEDDRLHLLCWSEYVPDTVVATFQEATGAKVEFENYNSNEQMLAKLRAKPGYYDLIQPSGFYVETLAKEGLLEPLDHTRLPNLANLDPDYRGFPFDPEGRYSVPWLSGTVGIVVNTAVVKEPVCVWADAFSGQYRGRIVVVDDPREMVAWALASVGLPITDVSDGALTKIEPVLERWLPQIAEFDSDNPKSALLEGRADIGIVWSGEAAALWKGDHKFQYVIPERGAHRFVDSLAIPKGAPHRELAERFINHCLDPKTSMLISKAYPYTNPNVAARRLLTDEERANPASYPADHAKLPMLRNEGNDTRAVSEFVSKIRARLGK